MSDSIIIYGIANCDTIKKAKKWLSDHGIAFEFHDYRKQGLDPVLLQTWIDALGWEALINKRGTTWRQLPDTTKQMMDDKLAITTILDNPAIIKRPLLVKSGKQQIGFSEASYSKLLG